MVKILRLSDSDDIGEVADAQRGYRVVERVFAEATGEAVETFVRVVWPSPALPGLIDGWITRYEPDLVIFKVNGYWFVYRSLPLQIRRRLGLVGRPLGRAGQWAASRRWLSRRRAFKAARGLLVRRLGGAHYFETAEVIETMTECVRTIARHEQIGIVVRTPIIGWLELPYLTGRQRDEMRSRLALVEAAAASLCASTHAIHVGRDPYGPPLPLGDIYEADGLHLNVEAQEWYARKEAGALAVAWRAQRGERSRRSERL